jgi:hypothetical protein
VSKQGLLQSRNLQKWKSVTARLKEDELAILNSKLKLNGFETFSEFVHAWILAYDIHYSFFYHRQNNYTNHK